MVFYSEFILRLHTTTPSIDRHPAFVPVWIDTIIIIAT